MYGTYVWQIENNIQVTEHFIKCLFFIAELVCTATELKEEQIETVETC